MDGKELRSFILGDDYCFLIKVNGGPLAEMRWGGLSHRVFGDMIKKLDFMFIY